jgi:hypothetical protein
MRDKRRFGVIEVERINDDLTISGEMWSEVEWSPSRQRWCIQDWSPIGIGDTKKDSRKIKKS